MHKIFSIVLALVLTLTPATFGAEAKQRNRPETDIEKSMDQMGGAFRKLRRQISDSAQNAASLELIGKIRAGAQEARKYVPQRAADLPEADRAKFTGYYQSKMDEFIAALDKLADAIRAGDNAEAAKQCSALDQLRRADHREFQRPETPGKK